jgi:diaminobutyrate-2-oxoglutarate transaminase
VTVPIPRLSDTLIPPATMTQPDTIESNVRSYCRSFPVTFDRAIGSEIFGEDGRRFIDFFCGAGALNYGHNDPRLTEPVLAHLQRNGILHSLDMATASKRRFLQAFSSHVLKPRGLDYRVQFTGPTGATAVEAALKLARKVTGRHAVMSFTNGYHGVSAGALAVTANRYYKAQDPTRGHSVFLPYDGYLGDFDTMDLLERVLSDSASGYEPPAAFIVETVQAEGGIRACSARWLQRLAALARRVGSLLIVDEIQTGCGRCGPFFSFEELGVVPDIVTLSKSIGGLGLPLALVLIQPRHDLWQAGEHNGTFRGNNLAFVAGEAAIEAFWTEPGFQDETQRKGERVRRQLSDMAAALGEGATVRGRGLLYGLDCGTGERAGAISRAAFAKGLVVERCGAQDEVVKVMPALTIDDRLLDEGLGILAAACSDAGRPASAGHGAFAGSVTA